LKIRWNSLADIMSESNSGISRDHAVLARTDAAMEKHDRLLFQPTLTHEQFGVWTNQRRKYWSQLKAALHEIESNTFNDVNLTRQLRIKLSCIRSLIEVHNTALE
jgi:hypothetical protein